VEVHSLEGEHLQVEVHSVQGHLGQLHHTGGMVDIAEGEGTVREDSMVEEDKHKEDTVGRLHCTVVGVLLRELLRELLRDLLRDL